MLTYQNSETLAHFFTFFASMDNGVIQRPEISGQ